MAPQMTQGFVLSVKFFTGARQCGQLQSSLSRPRWCWEVSHWYTQVRWMAQWQHLDRRMTSLVFSWRTSKQMMHGWLTSLVLRHSKATTMGWPTPLPNIPDKVESGPCKGGMSWSSSSAFWRASPDGFVRAAMLELKGASARLTFMQKRPSNQRVGRSSRGEVKREGDPPIPPVPRRMLGVTSWGNESIRGRRGARVGLLLFSRCFEAEECAWGNGLIVSFVWGCGKMKG